MTPFERTCYVLLTLSALIMAGATLAQWGRADRPVTIEVGSEAPSLLVANAFGAEVVDAVSETSTLLAFFSTTCPFCLRSLDTYREIAQQMCGLRFVLVVLDQEGMALRDWWSENAWEPEEGACAHLVVGHPVEGASDYGVVSTPTHVLIRDGKASVVEVGALYEVPDWLAALRVAI